MEKIDFRVSTTSPSQWGRLLSIEVPRERFETLRTEVVRELRRQLVRPGFRKGHVPKAVVERDFAERIESSTLERLIPAVCDQAIERESLQVVSTPKVQKLVLDDPEVVRLELALEVRPALEIGSIDRLEATRWKPEAGGEDIERALGAIREQHAQFETVDRQAGDGDFVQVSYVPLDDKDREREKQKVQNYPFQLGAGTVVPEFESAVRGLRGGETARAEVRYAADHDNPEIAGKVVAFVLTLQEVKEKRLPDLDDELARDLGLETLEELRTRVKTDLERRLSEESERELRESLVDRLIETNPFEVPPSMTERYLEAVLADYDERYKRMNMEPDERMRQEYAEKARPAAERGVRRILILEALCKQEQVAITEEDVDKWIEEKVQAGGSAGAEVRSLFADGRRRRRLKSELVEDRVFEFLKSKATIREVDRPNAPQEVA